jgi:excisionase family DNA binding protein
MIDRSGVRWLTVREAATETGMSRPTIMAWISAGLPSQMIRGRRWVPEPELFSRLRASLSENPRVKTRWTNRRRD